MSDKKGSTRDLPRELRRIFGRDEESHVARVYAERTELLNIWNGLPPHYQRSLLRLAYRVREIAETNDGASRKERG